MAVRLPGVWEDTVPPPALCAAPAGGGAAGPLRPGRPGGAGRRAALLLRLCRAAAAGHAPGTGGQQTFTHLALKGQCNEIYFFFNILHNHRAASCKHFQCQNCRFRAFEAGYWKDFQISK